MRQIETDGRDRERKENAIRCIASENGLYQKDGYG